MRVVLDPSVVASAAISHGGASRKLLLEFRAGAFEIVMSPQTIAEIGELLNRPRIRRYLSGADAEAIVELLRRESVMIEDPADLEPALSDDRGADHLLAVARAGSANAVVATDPHLTALSDRLPIVTPTEFLLYQKP
jgi:putative PIN family toxin of toxin-antitoxin system